MFWNVTNIVLELRITLLNNRWNIQVVIQRTKTFIVNWNVWFCKSKTFAILSAVFFGFDIYFSILLKRYSPAKWNRSHESMRSYVKILRTFTSTYRVYKQRGQKKTYYCRIEKWFVIVNAFPVGLSDLRINLRKRRCGKLSSACQAANCTLSYANFVLSGIRADPQSPGCTSLGV